MMVPERTTRVRRARKTKPYSLKSSNFRNRFGAFARGVAIRTKGYGSKSKLIADTPNTTGIFTPNCNFDGVVETPRYRAVLKRLSDIALSTIGLLMLMPLLATIALAIKISSPGPVLFRQKRYGFNDHLFTVLKFRTMKVEQQDQSGVAQTTINDPRITRVGCFLRKTSFDELPQLWNVLKGDMSLVGPRPHVPYMLAAGVPYEHFDANYMIRHKVKPGITGLAQVNGFRGETSDEHAARMRLYYDLQYVQTFSNRRDAKILVVTAWKEFFTGTGY